MLVTGRAPCTVSRASQAVVGALIHRPSLKSVSAGANMSQQIRCSNPLASRVHAITSRCTGTASRSVVRAQASGLTIDLTGG